ncbi:MAG TPA: hypothetical protein VH247_12680 [Thermoleophilaceae bacterium]|nr:hypothetical protein [Thermoleophilaceae bacterium]
MNLERLRWGEWIAAICALDLLLVTFRSWYKVTGGGHVTAWDALEQGRYLLLATAAAGIFLWIARAAEDTPERFPIGWVTAGIGLACTVYIAYRLATPPSDNLDPDIGLFLGLASALGVAIGGLMSAREPEAAYVPGAAPGEAVRDEGGATGPAPFAPEPSTSTWSPAAPAPSTSGWSPAAPTPPVPPATAAGAAEGGERPLRRGDLVVLTGGGARFPAGTIAEVVEPFGGGALVEVKAPDGVAERFEVPESAYEPAPAGAATGAGEGWSPGMPAAASEDWGFDDGPGAPADAGAAAGLDAPGAQGEAAAAKVPWWKREIGGGKKKKEAEQAGLAAGAVAAGAAGAAAIQAGRNGTGDEKPGFFKRLFGGGSKAEPETETLEAESTPATDVAGVGQAAESDTAADEPVAETAVDEPPAAPAAADEPEAPEPEVEPEEPSGAGGGAAAGAGAAAAAAAASDPEPPSAEREPSAASAEPEPVAEPEPAAAEPATEAASAAAEPSAPSDEAPPASPAGEPETAAEPEAPAAPEPEPIASDDPEAPAAPEVPAASEPEPAAPESSGADLGAGAAAAGAGAAAASAASADEPEEEPKPTRKRSSGSRKIPKEALAPAGAGDQPKVGDEVELRVGGGRFNAGTKGTVVDVFSAGVIVELSDDEGRTERLDLPFEAIGPADR